MADAQPTGEEIARVRAFECANSGHTFSFISIVGSNDPKAIVCMNCGQEWSVTPALKDEHIEALIAFGESSLGPMELDDAHDEALDLLRRARG